MRDIFQWLNALRNEFEPYREEAEGYSLDQLCRVELGLCLLSELASSEGAIGLWALLSGYEFPIAARRDWTAVQRQMLASARYLLHSFRHYYNWTQALEQYKKMPEHLRGYRLLADGLFQRKEVSVCPGRFQIYAEALSKAPWHRKDEVAWAGAGSYVFPHGDRMMGVDIPQGLVFEPPIPHAFPARPDNPPRKVHWDEDLIPTARWMDAEEARRNPNSSQIDHWERRLADITLEVYHEASASSLSKEFTLDGLTHLVGMVSAGKSTLMDVLTVWAARAGLRVTLVVGDVVNALNRAKLFARLGLSVAPVLGASNRSRHTQRLHRVLAAEEPFAGLSQQHAGFRWLSTVCPLDGRRTGEDTSFLQPLELDAKPCLRLSSVSRTDDGSRENKRGKLERKACPIYSRCPFHQAQRDLVGAAIWIATPWSLVHTRVAPQVCPQRLRFAELVYRRSDLVIVDEADQVQVQLDAIFNPTETLAGCGKEAWLGKLEQHVVSRLNTEGREPLANERVSRWRHALHQAGGVTDRLYHLLQNRQRLRRWVTSDNHFTDIALLHKVAVRLSGERKGDSSPEYDVIDERFSQYLDEPLGDHELGQIARHALVDPTAPLSLQKLRSWVAQNKAASVVLPEAETTDVVEQLEFALLVTVLQHQIHYLTNHWDDVEAALSLENHGSSLFYKPSEEFNAIMPDPPMGQVLAFQYLCPNDKPNAPGELRFFRCLGVGRWLLLHLHELFAGEGLAGPHVLLLSGTSWAGTSPSYHLQVPVHGVLCAPKEEIAAIRKSHFEFYFQQDRDGRAISVSGKQGEERTRALEKMLNALSRPNGPNSLSLLEQNRDRLPANRRRILLLVGSYEEAKRAYEYLAGQKLGWKAQMRYLVPDDAFFDGSWQGGETASNTMLQRGSIHMFGQMNSWLLIAPLLAVERGHNILVMDDTEGKKQAAIGAAYFLVRPHPRPDDLALIIHGINHWAIAHHANTGWYRNRKLADPLSLDAAGKAFHDEAKRLWRYLLRRPLIRSRLPDEERDALTWTQLVSIWQVIGRLVRGGSPAHVYFCDAAFAVQTASMSEQGDTDSTSLLVNMKSILRPYCDPKAGMTHPENMLVQTLYGPLYEALNRMGGLSDATL